MRLFAVSVPLAVFALCRVAVAVDIASATPPNNGVQRSPTDAKTSMAVTPAAADLSLTDGADGGLAKWSSSSMELRRLAARPIPRRKGIPSLLASAGLLGHAGYQAYRSWNLLPRVAPYVSLWIGKAKFDTSNLGIYSLLAGLLLLYIGARRRLKSHQERNHWRANDILKEYEQRIQNIRQGLK